MSHAEFCVYFCLSQMPRSDRCNLCTWNNQRCVQYRYHFYHFLMFSAARENDDWKGWTNDGIAQGWGSFSGDGEVNELVWSTEIGSLMLAKRERANLDLKMVNWTWRIKAIERCLCGSSAPIYKFRHWCLIFWSVWEGLQISAPYFCPPPTHNSMRLQIKIPMQCCK